MIDTGARIAETWDCVRTTPVPRLFANGFEWLGASEWSAVSPP